MVAMPIITMNLITMNRIRMMVMWVMRSVEPEDTTANPIDIIADAARRGQTRGFHFAAPRAIVFSVTIRQRGRTGMATDTTGAADA